MVFFFYKGLTRNLDVGNTTVWVLPNTWRLLQVRDTKFDTDISNESLLKLNAANCQSYSFYRFWVIKGKEKINSGGVGEEKYPDPLPLPHTQQD